MISDILKKIYEYTWGDIHFIRKREWDKLVKWLEPKKDEKIIDIGCGSGYYTKKLAKKGCIVTGIDIDKDLVGIAKKYNLLNNCEYYIANAERLPFKSNCFDKAISMCAFEHFRNDEKAINEMGRVLKKSGIAVLSLDSFSYKNINKKIKEKHKITEKVVNYYTLHKIKSKMKKAGLRVVNHCYLLNSVISDLLMELLIKSNFNRLFLLAFPIFYPLSIVSDRIFGEKDEGYILLIKVKKEKK
jgi:ubiquinone/menaquinone biosynthesis C-methylase UbiE